LTKRNKCDIVFLSGIIEQVVYLVPEEWNKMKERIYDYF